MLPHVLLFAAVLNFNQVFAGDDLNSGTKDISPAKAPVSALLLQNAKTLRTTLLRLHRFHNAYP